VEVKVGSTFKLGRYDLKVADMKGGENDNYVWNHAIIEARSGNQLVATLKPELRKYAVSGSQTSNVAIRRALNEDLYLNFAGMTADSKVILQSYVFPLVSFIWVGYWVLLIGTLICLVPSKIKLQYAKMEVVGIARQPQPVEN